MNFTLLKTRKTIRPKNSKIQKIEALGPPCTKKVYYSLDEAQDMIKYIRENRRVREINAYKCLSCGFWHLTSKSK